MDMEDCSSEKSQKTGSANSQAQTEYEYPVNENNLNNSPYWTQPLPFQEIQIILQTVLSPPQQ